MTVISRLVLTAMILATSVICSPVWAQSQANIGLWSRAGTAFLKDGEFHCAVPTHPLATKYTLCNDIPVIVLRKADGSCLSLVPYVSLHVHTNKEETRIVWRIYGSRTANFSVADGIKLLPQAIDGTPQSEVFKSKTHLADRYAWVIKANAQARKTFKHTSNVVGEDGVTCEEIDPLIINVEN